CLHARLLHPAGPVQGWQVRAAVHAGDREDSRRPRPNDEGVASGAGQAEPRSRERAREARAGRGHQGSSAGAGRAFAAQRLRATRVPRGCRAGGHAARATEPPAATGDGEAPAAAAPRALAGAVPERGLSPNRYAPRHWDRPLPGTVRGYAYGLTAPTNRRAYSLRLEIFTTSPVCGAWMKRPPPMYMPS